MNAVWPKFSIYVKKYTHSGLLVRTLKFATQKQERKGGMLALLQNCNSIRAFIQPHLVGLLNSFFDRRLSLTPSIKIRKSENVMTSKKDEVLFYNMC